MQDTIYSLFEQTVRAHTNEPAILENNRTLTFGELSGLVDMIAGSFPKDVKSIGIVMSHRAEMIASMLAVLKCGARYIPAEPSFPIGRIRYMMEEAEVDFILTEQENTNKLNGFPTRLIDCEICGLETPASVRDKVQNPDAPAYVLYTSGTTGRPKGVCVTNRNVCHYIRAFENEFHTAPGDVMLQYSVCSFDIFVEEVYTSLLNGAALAIPSAEDKDDLHSLMDFVERHHVTMLSGFPYLLAEMNHLPQIPSSLRLLISGGDVLRGVYVDNLLDKAEVYNRYASEQFVLDVDGLPCVLENELLYEALLSLPDRERRVILYDFWYDWKDGEISKKLEVTVRTVYNLRQRAFKKIRTYYELHGQGRDP